MLKLVAKSLRNKYLHSSKVSPQEVFNYKGFIMEKPGRHHRKQRWKFTSPRNETPQCWEEQGSFLWDSCPQMHNQSLMRKHQTKPHRESFFPQARPGCQLLQDTPRSGVCPAILSPPFLLSPTFILQLGWIMAVSVCKDLKFLSVSALY